MSYQVVEQALSRVYPKHQPKDGQYLRQSPSYTASVSTALQKSEHVPYEAVLPLGQSSGSLDIPVMVKGQAPFVDDHDRAPGVEDGNRVLFQEFMTGWVPLPSKLGGRMATFPVHVLLSGDCEYNMIVRVGPMANKVHDVEEIHAMLVAGLWQGVQVENLAHDDAAFEIDEFADRMLSLAQFILRGERTFEQELHERLHGLWFDLQYPDEYTEAVKITEHGTLCLSFDPLARA